MKLTSITIRIDKELVKKFDQALEVVKQKSGVEVSKSSVIRAEVRKWINRQLNK